MKQPLPWMVGSMAALLAGCGAPSCPEGVEQVDGVCVVSWQDTGVVDGLDAARSDAASCPTGNCICNRGTGALAQECR